MYDFIDAEPSQLKIRHLGRQVKIRGNSFGNKVSETWPLYAQRFALRRFWAPAAKLFSYRRKNLGAWPGLYFIS
jgi:hypothetical protein